MQDVNSGGVCPVGLDVASIRIPKRMRELDQAVVATLVESISAIGLRTPIDVIRGADGGIVLVVGAHRVEAMKRLGYPLIPANILDFDENEARRWEVAENLHRGELSALERDEHIGEWCRLYEALARAPEVSQVGTLQADKPYKKFGIRAVAKALGLNKNDVQRAKKVSSLSPDAKQKARDRGMADNRSVLLKAANEKTPEAQIATIDELAEARDAAIRETTHEYDLSEAVPSEIDEPGAQDIPVDPTESTALALEEEAISPVRTRPSESRSGNLHVTEGEKQAIEMIADIVRLASHTQRRKIREFNAFVQCNDIALTDPLTIFISGVMAADEGDLDAILEAGANWILRS